MNTNTLEEEDTPAIDPASPASGSDHSNASSQDTFSAHFRKMHGKLLLRNKRYLEDLVYSALEKETVCGEKELWLLESCMYYALNIHPVDLTNSRIEFSDYQF